MGQSVLLLVLVRALIFVLVLIGVTGVVMFMAASQAPCGRAPVRAIGSNLRPVSYECRFLRP